jgi:hypothetical protein
MKTKLEFGKRGRKETEKTERKPTPMERLKRIGKWWRRIPRQKTPTRAKAKRR